MNNKLYVSNLSFSMRDAELQDVFSKFDLVLKAKKTTFGRPWIFLVKVKL